MTALDHGLLNTPLGSRARGGNLEAQIDRALAAERREKAAQHREDIARRREARAAEQARPKVTREDCVDARVVRDEFGWHVVVRVNAKSVTVKTPYSWTDTIALGKILEVRA